MKRLCSIILLSFLSAVLSLAADVRFIVIPVEFSDVRFTDTDKYVKRKVAEAKDYLDSQLSPRYTFNFEVLPTVRLPEPLSHYGRNTTTLKDSGLDEAVRYACQHSQTYYPLYDNDNDGYVDNVCLITAGYSEADGSGASYIWPQQGWLHDRGGALDLGIAIVDSFTACPEFASTGIFCHELCHVFGLRDMYDTDGRLSGGTAKGLWGSLSLMDNGGCLRNLCSVELDQLGLGTCIPAELGHHTLQPLSRSKEYLRIDSGNEGEYFLLECRASEGWDSGLGGSGLVIYHVDRSLADAWYSDSYRRVLSARERWEYNQVNCRPEHPCARIMEAVPATDNVSEIFYPQPGRNAFGSETDPAFRFWDGTMSAFAICNIESGADSSVSFDLLVPVIVNVVQVFQDAAIMLWTVDERINLSECQVSWKTANEIYSTIKVYPDSKGICSLTLEGLEPQTDYQVTIHIISSDGPSFSHSESFKTRVKPPGSRPFIYFNPSQRDEQGAFVRGSAIPLRVYNATDVRAVRWYFNGTRIYPIENGYWTIVDSGTLKAEIWHSDDSTEIIVKKLTVK